VLKGLFEYIDEPSYCLGCLFAFLLPFFQKYLMVRCPGNKKYAWFFWLKKIQFCFKEKLALQPLNTFEKGVRGMQVGILNSVRAHQYTRTIPLSIFNMRVKFRQLSNVDNVHVCQVSLKLKCFWTKKVSSLATIERQKNVAVYYLCVQNDLFQSNNNKVKREFLRNARNQAIYFSAEIRDYRFQQNRYTLKLPPLESYKKLPMVNLLSNMLNTSFKQGERLLFLKV
jgi:hypothetical protein